MKKLFIVQSILALVSFTPVCAQQSTEGYTVVGNISGLQDGDTIQLVPSSIHHREPAIAATVIKDGKFVFKGSIEEPRSMRLLVKDSYGGKVIMLENKNINVVGSASVAPEYKDITYYNFDVKVIGSPMTDRYYVLRSVRDSLDKARNAFMERHKDLITAQGKAYKEKDKEKMKALNESAEGKAMQEEDSKFFEALKLNYNKILAENGDTFWGPLFMLDFTSYLTPDQRPEYDKFSQAAKDSYYGKLVKEGLYPGGAIGQKVKPFTIKDSEGKEHSLASLSEGKKYILIDFWASWCAPCRREIPNLKELYKKYSDKGFEIISISIDQKENDWKKAVKEEGLLWPNFLSPEVSNIYKVKAIPAMYLIDKKGELIALDLRGAALGNKLAELLK